MDHERPSLRGVPFRLLKRAASILATAAATGIVFFGLLALWGVAAAPFVRLESASFVIVVALAVSSAIVVAGWRRLAVVSRARREGDGRRRGGRASSTRSTRRLSVGRSRRGG